MLGHRVCVLSGRIEVFWKREFSQPSLFKLINTSTKYVYSTTTFLSHDKKTTAPQRRLALNERYHSAARLRRPSLGCLTLPFRRSVPAPRAPASPRSWHQLCRGSAQAPLPRHSITHRGRQVAPLHASHSRRAARAAPNNRATQTAALSSAPRQRPAAGLRAGRQREGRVARGAAAEPRRGHGASYSAAVAAVRPRTSAPRRGALA